MHGWSRPKPLVTSEAGARTPTLYPGRALWVLVAAKRLPLQITTTFEIPGRRITRFLGPVFGITVRTRALGPDIAATVRGLVSGEVKSYTKLAEQIRQEALDRLVQEAVDMGANADVGMRFDSSEMGPGNLEVFGYGTAVVVE